MRMLLLTVPLLVLMGCAGSTPSGNIRVDGPSPSLTQPCESPIILPERELRQAEAERFWLRDRRNLVECKSKNEGLVNYVNELGELVR